MKFRRGATSIEGGEYRDGARPDPEGVKSSPRESRDEQGTVPPETTDGGGTAIKEAAAPLAKRNDVHVSPSLPELIAGIPITPEDIRELQRRRRLNRLVHAMLTMGLILSTALMLGGLALDVVMHRTVPESVPRLRDVGSRALALQPSGVLSMGLLILIATPIFSIIGSMFIFLEERDWRYVGVTFLVLVILSISLILSRG